jgi:hypothetical protein
MSSGIFKKKSNEKTPHPHLDITTNKKAPTLRAEDLTNAWAYARSHKREIDRQICLSIFNPE